MPPKDTIAQPNAGSSLGSSVLSKAEWFADNAYIPPGMHRLLTAFGLTAGLWTGRQLMDVITARRSSDGENIPADSVPEILRPLHGIMRYNPYSDAPSDRWMGVLDAIGPVAMGAFGAYLGSKHFFDNTFKGKPLHGLNASVKKQLQEQGGKVTLDIADGMMSKQQSDAISKSASATFVIGSSAGSQLTGALSPLNNGMNAARFQQGNMRNISLPLPTFMAKYAEKILGNHGSTSRRIVPAIREWTTWAKSNIAHNPSIDWRNEREIIKRADDLLQQFPTLTKAERIAFYKQCDTVLDKITDEARKLKAHNISVAQLEDALYTFAHKNISGEGLEKLYLNAGIDIRKAQTPDFGPFTAISRIFGSGKEESETLSALHKHWKEDLKLDVSNLNNTIKTSTSSKAIALATTGGTLAAGAGFLLSNNSKKLQEKELHTSENRQEKQSNNIIDWLNGKPLDAMQWMSRVLIAPPSMHRFMSAAYLSGGLWLGMKVADVMTGRHLPNIRAAETAKSLITKDQLAAWNPLRILHGTMSYTPGLSTTKDRWRQVAHHMIPVAAGAVGTYTGSNMFFKDRARDLQAPEYLEEYADAISYQQSKPFGLLTGITSIFNTGSGIHILPVFNYSANLHNRYLLANGQQVAFPIIGKWWSGNASTLPWGVTKTLKYTVNYLSANPTEHPRELPDLIHAVTAKLFPALEAKELAIKEDALMKIIHDIRAPFLIEGTLLPAQQPKLREALTNTLTKSGLETTLQQAGFDITKADLSNNGASGAIANALGQAHAVKTLEETYKAKAITRLQKIENKNNTLAQKNIVPAGNKTSDAFQSRIQKEREQNQEVPRPATLSI